MADQIDLEFERRKSYVRGFNAGVNAMLRHGEQLKHDVVEEQQEDMPRIDGPLPLDTPLEQLDIEAAIFYSLHRAGMRTVGDVVQLGEDGLRDIRQIGRERVQKIKLALGKAGHRLT